MDQLIKDNEKKEREIQNKNFTLHGRNQDLQSAERRAAASEAKTQEYMDKVDGLAVLLQQVSDYQSTHKHDPQGISAAYCDVCTWINNSHLHGHLRSASLPPRKAPDSTCGPPHPSCVCQYV